MNSYENPQMSYECGLTTQRDKLRATVLLYAKGALASLTQPATYPADVEAARSFLRTLISEVDK